MVLFSYQPTEPRDLLVKLQYHHVLHKEDHVLHKEVSSLQIGADVGAFVIRYPVLAS